ncbi:hypothetical protein SAMN02927924_01661 [Sphingobium faniae]|nr:hypothetical protein SAMN02927924_01661 [Sphingobium faniae]
MRPPPNVKHDVYCVIRKRYGSIPAFEREKGLYRRSVTDVLCGKKSRKTQEAVAAEIGHTVESLFGGTQSAVADISETITPSHRINAEVR